MSKKTNVVKLKTTRKVRQPDKTKQNNEKAAHGGTGNSTHLSILPRTSPGDISHDLKGHCCKDHRPLVNKFLNENFYGRDKDIICEINHCSVCAWSTANGVNLKQCPVCGQAIRSITFVIERSVLAFEDTVLEIKSGK
jgi:hypothetical protein